MILGSGLQLVIAFSWKVFDANHDQEIKEFTQRQKAAAKEQSHATAYVSWKVKYNKKLFTIKNTFEKHEYVSTERIKEHDFRGIRLHELRLQHLFPEQAKTPEQAVSARERGFWSWLI